MTGRKTQAAQKRHISCRRRLKPSSRGITSNEDEQEEIKERLIQVGLSENDIITELELMEQNFPKNAETFMKIISGKDYLIHLMSCHAKKSLNYNTGHNKEAWKYNFAQYCKLDRLEHLKSVLISL